jgi:hypothetical protein
MVAYEGTSGSPGIALVTSNTRSPVYRNYRSRGSLAAPTDLIFNDVMVSHVVYGYCAGAYNFQAQYGVLCNGPPVGGIIPPKYFFTLSFNTAVGFSEAQGIELSAPMGISWAPALDSLAAKDSGVRRAGVNLVETNNGTPGTPGDHKLRNLFASGTLQSLAVDTVPLFIGKQPPLISPYNDFPGAVLSSETLGGSALQLYHAAGDYSSMGFRCYKARGTLAAPAAVQNGDSITGHSFFAHNGSGYVFCGALSVEVAGAPGASVPTDIYFSNAAFTETLRLTNTGKAQVPVLQTTPKTVATLMAAATAGAGARSFVTDCSVAAAGNFGVTVTGGGAFKVPVYCDGAGWLIG